MPTTYAIPNGATAMLPVLWTGNGASSRSFTGWGFAPDFIWMKNRSNAANHALIDTVRGTGAKVLESDLTDAENSYGLSVTSFDSDGFTGATGSLNFSYANNNAQTYVGWGWKAGGAAVSNTSGSITSSVSANTTAGFSIVSATTTSAVNTIGHGLGVAPAMIIGVNRAAPNGWWVYHKSLTSASYYLVLNTTAAQTSNTAVWNGTAPTSTVFTQGSGGWNNAATAIFYCWAEIAGYSKFGSYTGNGSTDGPFVYLGFRPRYILWKCSSSDQGGNAQWGIVDTSRNTSNVTNLRLNANASSAEDTSNWVDILSNGFKVRETSTAINASGGTYIYAAFAENPFKYANAR